MITCHSLLLLRLILPPRNKDTVENRNSRNHLDDYQNFFDIPILNNINIPQALDCTGYFTKRKLKHFSILRSRSPRGTVKFAEKTHIISKSTFMKIVMSSMISYKVQKLMVYRKYIQYVDDTNNRRYKPPDDMLLFSKIQTTFDNNFLSCSPGGVMNGARMTIYLIHLSFIWPSSS